MIVTTLSVTPVVGLLRMHRVNLSMEKPMLTHIPVRIMYSLNKLLNRVSECVCVSDCEMSSNPLTDPSQ